MRCGKFHEHGRTMVVRCCLINCLFYWTPPRFVNAQMLLGHMNLLPAVSLWNFSWCPSDLLRACGVALFLHSSVFHSNIFFFWERALALNATNTARAVEDFMTKKDLHFDALHGIETDGAPVMTGKNGGAVKLLIEKQQALTASQSIQAVGIHCAAHRLNLAACQAAKEVHTWVNLKDYGSSCTTSTGSAQFENLDWEPCKIFRSKVERRSPSCLSHGGWVLVGHAQPSAMISRPSWSACLGRQKNAATSRQQDCWSL